MQIFKNLKHLSLVILCCFCCFIIYTLFECLTNHQKLTIFSLLFHFFTSLQSSIHVFQSILTQAITSSTSKYKQLPQIVVAAGLYLRQLLVSVLLLLPWHLQADVKRTLIVKTMLDVLMIPLINQWKHVIVFLDIFLTKPQQAFLKLEPVKTFAPGLALETHQRTTV